jgi:hypothetical protein
VRPPKNCVQQAIPIPEEGDLKKSVPQSLGPWAAKLNRHPIASNDRSRTFSASQIGYCPPGARSLVNPATLRQPVRDEVVTHVLGTFCYLSVRAGHVPFLREG